MGHVPEPVARVAVSAVVRTMAWRGGEALAMNERHMRRVLASECVPGVEPDAALVRRLSRRSYRAYGRYWLDGARLPYTAPDVVRGRMSFDGESEEHGAGRRGRGAGHGDGAATRRELGVGRGLVGPRGHADDGGGRARRARAPLRMVRGPAPGDGADRGAPGRGLGSGVAAGAESRDVVGLVSDRDLVGNGVEVEFFGERTTLPGGAATLALRTGAVLLPVMVYSGPGNWHTGVVHPPLDTTRRGSLRADVQRLTQELATCLRGVHPAHTPSSGTSTSPTGRVTGHRPEGRP